MAPQSTSECAYKCMPYKNRQAMLANPTQVVSVAVLIITIASITTTEDTLHTVANPTCKASSSEYAARGPQRIEEDKQTNKQTSKIWRRGHIGRHPLKILVSMTTGSMKFTALRGQTLPKNRCCSDCHDCYDCWCRLQT